MNKKDLVVRISKELGFTQKDVTAVVDTMIATIVDSVSAGETVKIAGLGKFTVSERSARIGRNPQTGETIDIPASRSPKFKAGKTFKDAVRA